MDDLPDEVQVLVYAYAGRALVKALLHVGALNPHYSVVAKWRARGAKRKQDNLSPGGMHHLHKELAWAGDVAGLHRLLGKGSNGQKASYIASFICEAALEGALACRPSPALAPFDGPAAEIIREFAGRPGAYETGLTRAGCADLIAKAVARGDHPALAFLLELRQSLPEAPPTEFDSDQGLPIRRACRAGDLAAYRMLVEHGFGPPSGDLFGAAARGHLDLSLWAAEHGAAAEVLSGAVSGGQIQLVARLALRPAPALVADLRKGFYRGAAAPGCASMLALLQSQGWFPAPGALLEHAIRNANAPLAEEQLVELETREPDACRRLVRCVLIRNAVHECVARGGYATLVALTRRSDFLMWCWAKADALLESLVGLDPRHANARFAAPPNEACRTLDLLRSWGAFPDAASVRAAARHSRRALFLHVAAAVAPAELARARDLELPAKILREAPRQALGRMIMVRDVLWPTGLPPGEAARLIAELARDGKRFYSLRPCAALITGADQLTVSIGGGSPSPPDGVALSCWEAAPFVRRDAKVVAVDLCRAECGTDRACTTKGGTCGLVDLADALRERGIALEGIPLPARNRLCMAAQKALPGRSRKRKRRPGPGGAV